MRPLVAMLFFLVRGAERKSYELRLSLEGAGFELVVRDEQGTECVEMFATLERALAREHELLRAWRAVGWADPPTLSSRRK